MKRPFSLLIFILSFLLITPLMSFSSENGSGGLSSTESLSLKAVKVIDSLRIRVVFTEPVDIDSVTLRINKQSNNNLIRINILTGVIDSPESVDLTLGDELIEGSSYSVTVVSAVSISGSAITDGAEAIKDFSTPVPLKKSSLVLNAPPNPSAIIVKEGTGSIKKDQTSSSSGKIDQKEKKPLPTEELPLTGMNSFFLIFFALFIAYIFLRIKRV